MGTKLGLAGALRGVKSCRISVLKGPLSANSAPRTQSDARSPTSKWFWSEGIAPGARAVSINRGGCAPGSQRQCYLTCRIFLTAARRFRSAGSIRLSASAQIASNRSTNSHRTSCCFFVNVPQTRLFIRCLTMIHSERRAGVGQLHSLRQSAPIFLHCNTNDMRQRRTRPFALRLQPRVLLAVHQHNNSLMQALIFLRFIGF
jgi:hypothetical protein